VDSYGSKERQVTGCSECGHDILGSKKGRETAEQILVSLRRVMLLGLVVYSRALCQQLFKMAPFILESNF
jgi:hypothetical protein